MTDDYDIERDEAQFEHDMEQIDRIAEMEGTIEQLEARISELARENAELRQIPRHVDDSPRCPLRDSMTGEMGACVKECAWLMTDWTEPSVHACAVAVMASHTGKQMTEDDKNTWVIENEVS